MNKVSRADLRGRKLEKFCAEANASTNEFRSGDNRVFCYGLNDASTEELIDECKNCKANVIYAVPIEKKRGASELAKINLENYQE